MILIVTDDVFFGRFIIISTFYFIFFILIFNFFIIYIVIRELVFIFYILLLDLLLLWLLLLVACFYLNFRVSSFFSLAFLVINGITLLIIICFTLINNIYGFIFTVLRRIFNGVANFVKFFI